MKKNLALLNPLLEAFMSVAKHKSVHGASRAIYMSQTAVTQRIQRLEKNLKTTLFIRTRQGMQMTSEGEQLLRYCQVVTDFSQETLMTMLHAGVDSVQRVKISGPSSIMISRIIPAGLKMMQQFPHLYITFDVNDTDEVVESLRSGASQFAILEPEQVTRDMKSKRLLPEKYLLVCTKKWKGRRLDEIIQTERIIDFDESDQMTMHYLKQFDLLQQADVDRLFVNRTESLSTMLIQGYGYGVLTKEFSQSLLKKGDLMALNGGKALDHVLKLAWYARPEPPHYFSAMMNAIT